MPLKYILGDMRFEVKNTSRILEGKQHTQKHAFKAANGHMRAGYLELYLVPVTDSAGHRHTAHDRSTRKAA